MISVAPTENRIPNVAGDLTSSLFARSDIYAVVAEVGGQIVGRNFLTPQFGYPTIIRLLTPSVVRPLISLG